MNKLLLIFIILIFKDLALCQNNKLQFTTISTWDGLSNNAVLSLAQDHNGFLWFGTEDGLNKYDGSNFTIYRFDSDDSTSLTSNIISCLLKDSENKLWIGTNNGINLYNQEKVNFKRFYLSGEKSNYEEYYVVRLFEDKYKNIWAGTNKGLYLFNRELNKWKRIIRPECENKTCNIFLSIAEEINGQLIFGTEAGLLKFDRKSQSFSYYFEEKQYDIFKTLQILSLRIDRDDHLWIGTRGEGLFLYDKSNKKLKHFSKTAKYPNNISDNIINDIKEYQDSTMWIATDYGLNIYNNKDGSIIKYFNSDNNSIYKSENILNLLIDNSGRILFGTRFGGVQYYDPLNQKFEVYRHSNDDPNSLVHNNVSCFSEDANHKIWITTDGGGLNCFDPSSNKFIPKGRFIQNAVKSLKTLAVAVDKENNLWIGTWNDGLYRINISTNQLNHYIFNKNIPNSISSNSIFYLFIDKKDNLWIGTFRGGLNKYDKKNRNFIQYPTEKLGYQELKNAIITSISEDSQANIWFGTQENGLYSYNTIKDSLTAYKFNPFVINTISTNRICGILEDSRRLLWIGSEGGGLNLYNKSTGKFINYNQKKGLPSESVYGILEDNEANLWLSSSNGLSKAIVILSKDSVIVNFKNYQLLDALQSRQFNKWSYFKSSNGDLYFGGTDGFNRIKPEKIIDNPHIPPVYITEFYIFNKKIKPDDAGSPLKEDILYAKEIKLSYKQNFITFRFIALNYTNSKYNQYSYFLENFDKDWINSGTKNEATYTNLQPGEYIFRVKGSNNDGIWNEKGASVRIIILPPFWDSILFRISVILLIFILLYLIYLYRVKRIQNQKIILEKLVRARTLDLESRQHEIQVQNEELQSQREEIERQNDELHLHRNRLEDLILERTAELEQSKIKAETSEKLKSSFLENITHEIRTPMNSIIGFSDLLENESLSKEERKEYLNIIKKNGKLLLNLINDIIDISRIESGEINISRKVCNINSLLTELYRFFSKDIKDQNPRLSITLNVQNKQKSENQNIKDTFLYTDPIRLQKILINLINNAIKFTEKGQVEFGFNEVTKPDFLKFIEFYVRDTGIGISEEDCKLIFEKFRKAEVEKMKLYRGAGLGLNISKRFVEILGGSIRLESKIGEGSTFYFTIPYEPIISADNKKQESIKILKKEYQNKKILVAEDEPANYKYINILLKSSGIKLDWANNGRQAVEMFEKEKYDMVLMDLKMPIMDGYEALKKIKEISPKTPVIAQTAYALGDESKKMEEEGFDGCISKPFKGSELMQIIQKFIP